MLKKLFGKDKGFEDPDFVEQNEKFDSKMFLKETMPAEVEENFKGNSANGKSLVINRDSTIGDVIEKYPEVIEPLTNHGIHCVGCHVSPFETLEMGLKGHGMSDSEVDDVLNELNEIVSKSGNENKVIDENVHLTSNAADRIKSLSNGKEKALRIYVERGGCSGYTYEMEMVDGKKDGDLEFKEKGAKIFVAKDSVELLKGSYVDYLDSLQGAGFKIKNPNANQTCGCGESFG